MKTNIHRRSTRGFLKAGSYEKSSNRRNLFIEIVPLDGKGYIIGKNSPYSLSTIEKPSRHAHNRRSGAFS
ncbi:MAG TPA: hypothetical protein PK014_14180 [Thermoanaerobaculia bacterium]|nr:hypothetical protein [Thermoanaerobaculia bacterium]HUM31212.1 hypothetical protein [Thermoanaerobaculia bacterium]HXK69552.1 hypothetical protein [Thermoanaerobaculia bacterium]